MTSPVSRSVWINLYKQLEREAAKVGLLLEKAFRCLHDKQGCAGLPFPGLGFCSFSFAPFSASNSAFVGRKWKGDQQVCVL